MAFTDHVNMCSPCVSLFRPVYLHLPFHACAVRSDNRKPRPWSPDLETIIIAEEYIPGPGTNRTLTGHKYASHSRQPDRRKLEAAAPLRSRLHGADMRSTVVAAATATHILELQSTIRLHRSDQCYMEQIFSVEL
jgi:hypothetical protein